MTEACVAGCHFCDALADSGDIGATRTFLSLTGEATFERTVYSTTDFSLLPTIGQLVEGYLLLLSNAHYPSMSHLPQDLFPELERLCVLTRQILSNTYSRPVFFEHGPMPYEPDAARAVGGGSCVDHAHFHCVPAELSGSTLRTLLANLPGRRIDALDALREQAARNMPYVFFETNDGSRYVFDAQVLPSQYVRRLIAAELGTPEIWNWQGHPGIGRVAKTVRKLRPQFARGI